MKILAIVLALLICGVAEARGGGRWGGGIRAKNPAGTAVSGGNTAPKTVRKSAAQERLRQEAFRRYEAYRSRFYVE